MHGCGMRQRQSGFGVIEIMLAMLISLILLSGVIQIYTGSKESYVMAENLSRMQENARFAVNMLAHDIRMAGFMPCRTNGNMANTVQSTSPMVDFFNGALRGYEGNVSTFPSDAFPAAGTAAGDRVATSDGVIVLRGASGNQTYHVLSHNGNSAQFKLNKEHNFRVGQIAMVCDGNNAAIFQITNSNPSNETIVHNEGTGTPGNCSKHIKGNGDCTNETGLKPESYGDDAQVVAFEGRAYYIGVGSRGNTNSLYRVAVLDNATMAAPEELLEGIESMQILYGVDANGDRLAESYVTAGTVGDWTTVVSVRLGLLIQTPEEVGTDVDNRAYYVAGTTIGTSGTVQHAADGRLRYAFNSTIKLRNRGLR